MLHKTLLCNTWRGRLYYYSSGTTFAEVCNDLEYFVENEPNGLRILLKLRDVGMLRELVGDAILAFITAKPAFFKDAMISKHHFWLVPAWKRALLWVFMCRYVCGKKGVCVIFHFPINASCSPLSFYSYKHFQCAYRLPIL